MEHPLLLISIPIFLFFLSGFSCPATEVSGNKAVVGGQCEYKKYKGRARIISISKKEQTNNRGRPSYERFEVKFCFYTDQTIEERHGQVNGEEYLLLLDNSSYPGTKFLQKYGIEVGKDFDCYLKVITRGTCTPILFDFPTIHLSDLFENQR